MYIEYIKIKNFRNLDNIEINFHPEINFIVGENDLGKSNLLDLLNIIFNRSSFSEEDFYDKEKEIEIVLKIFTSSNEIGIFDDCIDSETGTITELKIIQNIEDDRFKVLCNENEDNINISSLKCINFIKYSPIRKPEEDFNIASNKGVSKIFKYFIQKVIEKNTQNLLNEEEIKKVIESINSIFSKISIFKDFKLAEESNPVELIARILKIKDKEDLDIFKSGHGFQFSLILFLYILERLIQLKENKRKQNCIFGDEDQKSFSLILGLDEPEIHLHPFMQRQLIKELQKIIRNENENFKLVLKEIFSENEKDIEEIKIKGQMFVVTHSPYILTHTVKQYVRFLRKEKNLRIISGRTLSLGEVEYKQFLLQFKNIKESFFSKCCLIVEGDMEYGIFPYFLDKISGMHRNLEKNREAVFLINAGSKNNILPLFKVLDFFHIPMFIIADRDYDYEKNKNMKESINNLYFTKYKDFEEELVNKLIKLGKENLLVEFILEIDEQGENRTFQKKKLQKINNKYKLGLSIKRDVKLEEMVNFNKILKKLWLLTWLDINKSIYRTKTWRIFIQREKH